MAFILLLFNTEYFETFYTQILYHKPYLSKTIKWLSCHKGNIDLTE